MNPTRDNAQPWGPGADTASFALTGGLLSDSTTPAASAQMPLLHVARRYHGWGLNVIPTADDKRPVEVGAGRLPWGKWKGTRQTLTDLERLPWGKATGLAAICGPVSGGLVCPDFDPHKDGDLGAVNPSMRLVHELLSALGLPADYGWLVRSGSGRGYHAWVLCPGLVLPADSEKGRVDRPARADFAHIELRYTGHYALLPGGGAYAFVAGDWPEEAPATVTPEALLAAYDAVTLASAPKAARTAKAGATTPATRAQTVTPDQYTAYAKTALDRELATLAAAQPGNRNNTLNQCGLKLAELAKAGVLNWQDVSTRLTLTAQGAGLTDQEIAATLASAYKGASARALPAAAAAGSSHSPEHDHGTPGSNGSDPARPPTTAGDETREDLTDLGNARRLVRLYGQNLRYVEAWGWLVWDGKRWQKDETGAVMRLAKRTALTFYQDATRQLEHAAAATKAAEDASAAGDEGAEKTALDRAKAAQKGAKALTDHAKRCQARSQLENMVKLAQSEPGIPAVPDDFDRDPWLLNVANGLLDLRTGRLNPHERGALATKLAPVAYDPAAPCPRWLAFLDRIFAGDQDLAGFVQRLTGYSLTGSTRDHVLPFCHGRGANGKSTMTGAIMAMLGDYAQKARRSLVTLGRNDDGGPTPDKARLKGARFVVVNETEEGRRLAESDVKDLTGSDRITAAYKYKDPFEFDPTHKLWLYGNGKPQITGTDEGIWRRVKYIPFEVVIPEAERDPHLSEKLTAELPGIFAWAVAGCLDWQRGGLREPDKVRAATAAYREEQDVLAAFLADCCIDGPSYQVTATDLYGAYKTWCEETGVKPESQRRLAPRLRERGYTDGERETTATRRKLWRGLALVGQPVQEALLTPPSEPLREPSEPLEPLFRKSPIELEKPVINTSEKRFQRFPKVPMTDQDGWEEGEL